jgi:hypothetical protein
MTSSTEPSPVGTNVELVVVESWRIASHQRSSGTRNYIGAIISIPEIRAGTGEFRRADRYVLCPVRSIRHL